MSQTMKEAQEIVRQQNNKAKTVSNGPIRETPSQANAELIAKFVTHVKNDSGMLIPDSVVESFFGVKK